MEIRNLLRGQNTGFAPARSPGSGEKKTNRSTQPSTDRLELSRAWVKGMEERRAQSEAALLTGAKEKKSNSILDMLDEPSAEEEELDALSKQLKTQRKCVEIAARIMSGKRVPPQDERYLMEHDPEGYKLAMAMRKPPKRDEKECESVLDEEDMEDGGTSETEQAAPVESAPSGDGDVMASGGGEE